MIIDFYRQSFGSVFLRLRSNESLGLIDSDRIEDENGVDGQVTLEHEGGSKVTMLMAEEPGQTPGTPNDVLIGQIPIATLLDGIYTFIGRVVDTLGNERNLINSASPGPDDVVLQLRIVTGIPVFPSILSGAVIEAVGVVGSVLERPVLLGTLERSINNVAKTERVN